MPSKRILACKRNPTHVRKEIKELINMLRLIFSHLEKCMITQKYCMTPLREEDPERKTPIGRPKMKNRIKVLNFNFV